MFVTKRVSNRLFSLFGRVILFTQCLFACTDFGSKNTGIWGFLGDKHRMGQGILGEINIEYPESLITNVVA